MPGRTERQADSEFTQYFRESLSVITDAHLLGRSEGDARILLYEPPVRVQRKGDKPAFVSITQTYTLKKISDRDPGYKAQTTSYAYALLSDDLSDLVEFHWHPQATKNLKWPHLHVVGNSREGELKRIHFPTSRTAIEDFIKVIIRDYGVKARMPHDEWKAILTKNKAAFVDSASWLYWKPLI